MLPNKKFSVTFLLAIASAAILFLLFEPDKSLYYWLGLLAGGISSILTIAYMVQNRSIDPKAAQPAFRERMESPWVVISVVGSLLLGRIIFGLIPSYLEVLLISFVLSWIILTFGYVALELRKHS